MNDKELADRVVALGVEEIGQTDFRYTLTKGIGTAYMMPEIFVRDWRVAGALMERAVKQDLWFNLFQDAHDQKRCVIDLMYGPDNKEITDMASDRSLPRAIIEACVEALQEQIRE